MRTLLFDTETTDLIANSVMPASGQPHIIEFYGNVIDDAGEVLEELDFLCNPGVPVTETITNITGIHSAQVADLPSFSHYADRVQTLIENATVVVAHNLAYDFAVVSVEFARLGRVVDWPIIRICTVEETEWFKGYRLKLSDLHEHLFGTPHKGAHRAKADVQALTRCFVELRKQGHV